MLLFSSSRHGRRGFTLVELLFAVAIIGILTAIAAQNFRQSKIRARDVNVKSSVREYRQGLELYHGQYKTYLVYDHAAGCTPSNDATKHPNQTYRNGTTSPYTLFGTGTGCTGFYGSGEGRITRRDITVNGKTVYGGTSIADVLKKEGYINAVQTYPEVKNFTDNNAIDGKPNDYILTLCDGEGKEASSEETAANFAIYAQTKTAPAPAQTEAVRVDHLCGSKGTGTGWNVLDAYNYQEGSTLQVAVK